MAMASFGSKANTSAPAPLQGVLPPEALSAGYFYETCGQLSDYSHSLTTRLTTLHLSSCIEAPTLDPGRLKRVHRSGKGKVHQPGIEPGSRRWQRRILPLDH